MTITTSILITDIYNASFYDDYVRYGSCPGYGQTKEMMEESISKYALDVTPEQLLTGVGIDDANETPPVSDRIHIDKADMKLLEDYHGMQDSQRKRLLAYVQTLKKLESLEDIN